MHHVFVSYAREDAAFVEPVVAGLEAQGIEVWIDRRGIEVSLSWTTEVRSAIAAADVVAVFVSPAQHRSNPCRFERYVAAELGKPEVGIAVTLSAAQALDTARQGYDYWHAREWAHTELLVRSANWRARDENRGALVSGRLRRTLATAARHDPRQRSADAERFLRASDRRDRRRRAFAVLGTAVIGLSLLSYWFAHEVEKRANRLLANANVAFDTEYRSHQQLDDDAYGALHATAARVLAGHTAYVDEEPLRTAFDTNVPDASAQTRARATGFVTVAGSTATVQTARGVERIGVAGVTVLPGAPARLEAASSPARPEAAAAASPARLDAATSPAGPAARARSADGAWTAVAARDRGSVDVRTAAASALVRRVWLTRPASALAFSPDRRLLAAGVGADVAIVDLHTGVTKDVLRGSVGPVRVVRWSGDGRRVWAISGAARVSGWAWTHGRLLADQRAARFVALSPVDRRGTVTAVTAAGDVETVDVASGRRAAQRTSARQVTSASFSDGQVALSDARGVLVRDRVSGGEWRPDTRGCIAAGTAFTEHGRLLSVACLNVAVRTFETAHHRLVRTVSVPDGGPLSLVAIGAGDLLVGGGQGLLTLIRADTRVAVSVRGAVRGTALYALAATADGRHVTFGGIGAGKASAAATGHGAGDDHWAWDQSLLLRADGQRLTRAAFSPDGQRLAFGLQDGRVLLRSGGSAQAPGPSWTENVGAIGGLAFTPDGRSLVVATQSGTIRVLPACPACDRPRLLAQLADARYGRAARAGLAPLATRP